MHVSRFIRAFAIAAVAAVSVAARADSQATEAAEVAVRKAIRTQLGAGYRVAFEDSTDRFLSFSEVIVDGRGHASQGDSWRMERSFTFSIKVKQDGSKTRDLKIKFSDGAQVTDSHGWEDVRHEDDYVRVTQPRWFQRLDDNDVLFAGEAHSDVTVTVINRDGRRVAQERFKPKNGKFRGSIYVPNGVYRAVIKTTMGMDNDEVRFSVRSANDDDWGMPGYRPGAGAERVIQIFQPSDRVTVDGPEVELSGSSLDRSVSVEVRDGRNRTVWQRLIGVRGGRWSANANLPNGSYRLNVSTPSGRDSDSTSFRVVGGGFQGSDEDVLQPSEPARNATVDGPRVTIAGQCQEDSVRVQIWNDSDRKIADRVVPVRAKYWNTQVNLDPGQYRITVDSETGRDSDKWNFRVRGDDDKPVSNLPLLLRVISPTRNGTVRGPRFSISGTCAEKSVRLQIWNSRNKQVADRNVRVDRGYWTTSVDLDNDEYRLRVQPENGRDYVDFWFKVRDKSK